MTVTRSRSFPVLAALGTVGLALAASGAHAQEVARVVSSVAVIQQVAVPRQVCTTQQVAVEQPRSGAGALLGAVAGGAAGNAIGDGSGRAAATLIGIMGGAILGNKIEGPQGSRMQDQTVCSTQNIYENRTVGYNVTYEYAGRQYQVQLPQDPGPTLQVQVTPVVPAATTPPTRVMQAPDAGPAVVHATGPVLVPVQRVVSAQPAVTVHAWVGPVGYGVYAPPVHRPRHLAHPGYPYPAHSPYRHWH